MRTPLEIMNEANSLMMVKIGLDMEFREVIKLEDSTEKLTKLDEINEKLGKIAVRMKELAMEANEVKQALSSKDYIN